MRWLWRARTALTKFLNAETPNTSSVWYGSLRHTTTAVEEHCLLISDGFKRQITNCSSPPCGPSCPPSLEQALGQSAAQAHRSLGGQFGNSLVPFQYWQKIHTKLYTLRNPGKGREHWEHSTRQAAGASAFGFPKERRRRRERFHIIRLEWKPQGRKMHSDFFFPKVEEEPKSEWAASRKIRFLCFTIRSPDCCFSIIMWIPGASCSYTPLKHWGLPFSC